MPISKFECTSCGKEFAKIFFRPEDTPKECPVCGAASVTEVGAAFKYDLQAYQRALGASCDTCSTGEGGDEGCSFSPALRSPASGSS
ncbi:FmdB family zinc ribbon protein [Thermodesulfobacteriota bacterium]